MSDRIVATYSDGGLVLVNPSPYAGTWAWRHVNDAGIPVNQNSGTVPWDGHGRGVSNNYTECLAIVLALEALPDGWAGRVCSDSNVALTWVFSGLRSERCPPELAARLTTVFARIRHAEPVLMAGHPTISQLRRGYGRNQNPCDINQVWCDHECTRLAQHYRRLHKIVSAPRGRRTS